MSSARLCVVILMAIFSVVAAALPNHLDAFEKLHDIRTDGDSAHDLDHAPGIVARTIDRGVVSIPVSGLVITRPTDFLIPGLPLVTAISVATSESTATSSVSPAVVTQVTFSLPGSTVTKTAYLTSVTKLTSATLSVSVTSTFTEPCRESTGLVSNQNPGPVVFTSTETEPCPNATTTNQPIEVVITISCSKGPCQSTVLPSGIISMPCSGNCQPTAVPVPVPCSSNCPTEPTPGVIKVGVSSTLSTGSRPTATAVIIPCSGSGCVVPVSCSGSGCHVTVPGVGTPGTPGATYSPHPVASTTSVIQYNGTADHQSGFLIHTVMVAVLIAVFLHAL